MNNKAMQRKLDVGKALDVSKFPKTVEGDYLIPEDIRGTVEKGGVDLCDSIAEAWIWSVGEPIGTAALKMADGSIRTIQEGGALVASISGKFYQAEAAGWRCLWLR